MSESSPERALVRLADLAAEIGVPWLVGGSVGLRLRGGRLDRPPRDLDLYADADDAIRLHDRLRPYATDEPAWSETERYRSLLSHYRLEGVSVELVGDFSVRARDSVYRTEVRRTLNGMGETYVLEGRALTLIPLGHELIFNLLRERADRAETAAALIREAPERHLQALRRLLDQTGQTISPAVRSEALVLAGVAAAAGDDGGEDGI
ncbi:nucleotidyltransferase domain-containing protein [Cohnella sp. REN36]|uniref:nucleotidyltransferase domain-containing protein n=1 Tax=Cohnella sp. REN36 TaxID=2887347 RepID=UPI001D142D61|nr:hypothetical protein [Cohnella sp. REN36]MCC3373502.1 hypothetical protein [Cohnella sp. REN36]